MKTRVWFSLIGIFAAGWVTGSGSRPPAPNAEPALRLGDEVSVLRLLPGPDDGTPPDRDVATLTVVRVQDPEGVFVFTPRSGDPVRLEVWTVQTPDGFRYSLTRTSPRSPP